MFKLDKIVAIGSSKDSIDGELDSVFEFQSLGAFIEWAKSANKIRLKIHLKLSDDILEELYKLASATPLDPKGLTGLLQQHLEYKICSEPDTLDIFLNPLREFSTKIESIGFAFDANNAISNEEQFKYKKADYAKAVEWTHLNQDKLAKQYIIPKNKSDEDEEPYLQKINHVYKLHMINHTVLTTILNALPQQLISASSRPVYHALFSSPMYVQYCPGEFISEAWLTELPFVFPRMNAANETLLSRRHHEYNAPEKNDTTTPSVDVSAFEQLSQFLNKTWNSDKAVADQLSSSDSLVRAETVHTLEVETITVHNKEQQVNTETIHDKSYDGAQPKKTNLSLDNWRKMIDLQLLTAYNQAKPYTQPTNLRDKSRQARFQWLVDHCICPIQGNDGQLYFHPDYSWIPGISDENRLELQSYPFRGSANQSGEFYANFWTKPHLKVELSNPNQLIHSYYPKKQEEVNAVREDADPFASVPNIPMCSITQTDFHYRALGQVAGFNSDNMIYYPKKSSEQESPFDSDLLKTIQHELKRLEIDQLKIEPASVENIYLRFGVSGLLQLKTLITLNPIVTQLYFSKFEQLDYFIEEQHIQKTKEALQFINALSLPKQRLFFRMIENIGLSRQPLDKIVIAYQTFIQHLDLLKINYDDLTNNRWSLPRSGYGPIDLMGTLNYILSNAKKNNCLEEQMECLNGLVITRLTIIPIFVHRTKLVCQEIIPLRHDNLDIQTLLSLGFEETPKLLTYEGVTNWSNIIERVKTYRDLFQFFVSEVPYALSVRQLALILSNIDINSKIRTPQIDLLFVLFVQRLRTKLSIEQAQSLLQMVSQLDRLHRPEIAAYIYQNKDVYFSRIEDILSFMETFKLFDHQPVEDKQFWLTFWREHNLAAKGFYAACKEHGRHLFTSQLPVLRALEAPVENETFTPYAKALFIALCENINLFDKPLQQRLFELKDERKINLLLDQIISDPHYYTCTQMHQFLASREIDEKKLTSILLGDKPKKASIDFGFCSTDKKSVKDIISMIASKNSRIKVNMSAEHILTIHKLNKEDAAALAYAFYTENVFDELEEDSLKQLVSRIYSHHFMTRGALCNKAMCHNVITNCFNLQSSEYFSHIENKQLIEQFLENGFNNHGIDLLNIMIGMLKNLNRAYLPLLESLSILNIEQQSILIPYCAQLAVKQLPVKLILEVVNRFKSLNIDSLKKAQLFVDQLGTFFEICKTHPSLPIILSNTDKIKPEKHAVLFKLLGSHSTDTIERFIKDTSPEFFDVVITAFGAKLTTDNTTKLSILLECFMQSYAQSKTINPAMINPAHIDKFIQNILDLSEDAFAQTMSLFNYTIPTMQRLTETLFINANSFESLINDPRGNRALKQRPQASSREARMKNISRVLNELTAESTLHSRPIDKHLLQRELNYLIDATESPEGIYQGNGPAQLNIKEFAYYFKKLREAKGLRFEDKARVALPLIQEALFIATGKTLNDTQCIALLQAIYSPTRVTFQNMSTGEGKSLVDMCKCALLWIAGDGSVEFTTSALPDAKRDFDDFLGFFNLLGIPVSNGVIQSSSPANAFKTNGINFSTIEELGLWCFQHGTPNAPLIHHVTNESDSALLDERADTPMRVATPEEILKENAWIYMGINAYLEMNRISTKQQVFENIQNNGIQDFLYQFSKGKPFEKQNGVIEKISTRQYIELFICAYWADKLVEDVDYKILEDANSKRHVHPMINHRSAQDIYTHFGEYSHGLLCAKINARPDIIQQGLTVELPPKTNSQAEGNTTGFIHSLLKRYPESYLWASSGTIVGSEHEKSLLAYDMGCDITLANIPMHRQLKRIDHPQMVTDGEINQFKAIVEIIQRIKSKDKSRSILVSFKDYPTSKRFADFLEKQNLRLPYQIYDGNPQGEKSFVDNARRNGMISCATPALGRNTNFENIDVVCGAVLSPRDELQLRGRSGRNGAEGETYQIVTQQDIAIYHARHTKPSIDEWNPRKDPYEFMSALSLSTSWLTLNNKVKKELFIKHAHQESETAERFIAFLNQEKTIPFSSEDDRAEYNRLVKAFVHRLSLKKERSFDPVYTGKTKPVSIDILPLINEQYHSKHLSFLRAPTSHHHKVKINQSIVTRWLSNTHHQDACIQYAKSWFAHGERLMKKHLGNTVLSYMSPLNEKDFSQFIQNPHLISLLKTTLPNDALKKAFVSQLNNHLIKHGATPELRSAIKKIQTNGFPNESLIEKRFIIESFKEYQEKSTFYIEPRRKKAMQTIIDRMNATDFDGDYYKLIYEQSKLIIEGDISSNASFFRFLKPIHLFGKSRFVTMLETMLPILAATRYQEKPIDRQPITQPHRFFGGGMDKVVDNYNLITQSLSF